MATVASDIRQLQDTELVSGAVPLATLRVNPEELAQRLGLRWSEGEDELGPFLGAVIESGRVDDRFVLLSYNDPPGDSMILLGSTENLAHLDDVIHGLGLGQQDVVDRLDEEADNELSPSLTLESVEDFRVQLREVTSAMRNQLARLEEELEASRLATLMTIEDVSLTPREREVLSLMVSGLDRQEVADRLQLSLSTVSRYFRSARNALVHEK